MSTTLSPNFGSTPSIPQHFAEPPPMPMPEPRLDPSVGWVKGMAIGFRGFANEVEAAHAAWVAYRTFARRLAWRAGRRPIPIDIEPVRVDGDQIFAGRIPIGMLVRPGRESRSGKESFGFELQAPMRVDEMTMHRTALALKRTLRRSGVRWQLYARPRDTAARARQPVRAKPAPSDTKVAEQAPTSLLAHLLTGRAVTLLAIALVFVMVAAISRAVNPSSPDAIPLYIIALAGLGAASVGMLIRRWLPRGGETPDSDRGKAAL